MKKYNIILFLCTIFISNVALAQILNNKSVFEKVDSVKKFSHYSVSSQELKNRSETSVSDALYGKIAGLMVMQNTHTTNLFERDATLNYRGVSTLGNSSMLTLIDGFERDITYLNIDEVAKIELLTNAVAQTMYGIRGANGALLITTKRGREGFHSKVNYSFGMDFPFRKPTFADAPTYANALNEALSNDGLAERYSQREIRYMQLGIYPELYPNVDWQSELYKDMGTTHQGGVEFDGGTDKFRYFTSLGYANQSAMFKPTNLDSRYNCQPDKLSLNLRVNLDVVLTKNTLLKVNMLGRLQEQTRTITSLDTYFQKLYNTPASAFPVKSSTGAWAANSVFVNPIAEFSSRGYSNPNRRTLYGDITITQKLDDIIKGLSAQASVAFDNSVNYLDSRSKTYAYEMISNSVDGYGNITGVSRKTYGVDNNLNFSKQMNSQNISNNLVARLDYMRDFENHNVEAGVIYEQVSSMNAGRNATRKRQSIMGIAKYTYDDRYVAEGVVNYSGSAVLSKGNRFNLYPAISLSWIASNESFLKSVEAVNYMDVYMSAGVSGMDLFGHDLYRQFYGAGGSYYFTNSDTKSDGNSEGVLPIPNLMAEKSKKINFGFNISLLEKLRFTTELFYENRSQIMVAGSNSISSAIGVNVPSICMGKVSNKGVEVSATWSDRIGRSAWRYHINGNFTYAKNKIIENNEEYRSEKSLYRRGGSMDQIWGLQAEGFFNDMDEINDPNTPNHTFSDVTVGDIRYKDQNNDGRINSNDFVRIGHSSLPEVYYGVNIGVSRGGFEITAQFQGVGNRSVMMKTPSLFNPLQNNTNISTWYLNENVRWTPQTKETANLPRLSSEDNPNNNQNSTVWLENGAYFKLRNVELSYTIPKKYTKWIEARLWIAGSNLFSLDHIGYADPEMLSASYPSMQSITFGANINF